MNYFPKRLSPIFLLLFLGCILYAQEKEQYLGPFNLGDYEGQATFEYITNEQDTIYHGPFELTSTNLGALLNEADTSFNFSGAFEQNKANGPWQFQFGKFKSNSESTLVGYEYRVLISGTQEQGSGTLQSGVPDGPWEYRIDVIKDSEIEQTLFKSNINFKKGTPQQSFQMENKATALVGRTLRNGLAHDEWESYESLEIENTERWIFEEGVLKSIIFSSEGNTYEIPVFENKGVLKTIPLDASFIEVLRVTIPEEHVKRLQTGIGALIRENAGYYKKMNHLLNELGEANLAPGILAKVPHYPLDSVQQGYLAQMQKDYEVAKEIADELLKNSHLNIIKRSDADALYKFKVTERINSQYLKPLGKVNKMYKQGIVGNIPTEQLLASLWKEGIPTKEITVSVDSLNTTRTFEPTNASTFNFKEPTTETLQQLAAFSKQSLTEIKSSLSDRLTNEARLQALNGLEEDLIQLNDSLVSKIDASRDSLPKKYLPSLKHIKKLADDSLAEYAALGNAEEKLAFGNDLKACIGTLHILSDKLITLPSAREDIERLYQDAVWNPFMATVMEEDVKKRITSAYKNELIPFFIKSAEKIQCTNAEELMSQIEVVNHRMEILRAGNTKKLERKLKREKDPLKIIQLLQQEVTSKDSTHE
ncbi:hypothetical protein [Euzebyella saccharophila]|uniref:Uncharacterized protein n=1 Tax=Euzebyella saccharophila TaxID=679664 RepID=A0ABV8JPG4_9FLAO|nr:hypothetical protein [Euzebyella saccharophila]